MGFEYLDVGKIVYESIRSAITTKKNDELPFLLMITAFCRVDQVNMVGLDIDVLLEKTITDEFIERYKNVNGYEDIKDERERLGIPPLRPYCELPVPKGLIRMDDDDNATFK
ncbi:hypothetical protein Syun_023499 [Stephania yunnanensis]|uniref:Uncharacterized protein n=1 Tax=Stephania yunnanensis TaxID=152371 RepID=A0AAP0HZN0_9MAGN